jgi:hypothetical protein
MVTLGFGGLGFGVWGLVLRFALKRPLYGDFRVWGLGFGVCGFGVWGLGFSSEICSETSSIWSL